MLSASLNKTFPSLNKCLSVCLSLSICLSLSLSASLSLCLSTCLSVCLSLSLSLCLSVSLCLPLSACLPLSLYLPPPPPPRTVRYYFRTVGTTVNSDSLKRDLSEAFLSANEHLQVLKVITNKSIFVHTLTGIDRNLTAYQTGGYITELFCALKCNKVR